MKKYLLVSINIRTYNSARTLDETLQSIQKQTYPNIEVLIADRHSTDGTVAIATKYHAKIHYAVLLGEARKKNYEKSRGEYVCSIDSDQILDSDLIKRCVDMCERGFDAITISEHSIIRKGTFVEHVIAYDKWLIDKTRSTDPIFGTACPRFFRKSALKSVDWLHTLSIFDDAILYSKLLDTGARVGYMSSASIGHYEVTNWTEVFKKFYRYGKGYIEALHELPLTVTTHSLPRRSYFSVYALEKPHYLVGLFMLYIVKAIAAGFGMVSSLLSQIWNKL